jgi:ADP-ribosylglycohydrolase
VPEPLKSQIRALSSETDAADMPVIEPLFAALSRLEPDPDFAFHQPNDLAGIRKARPPRARRLAPPDETRLLDRLHGAWIGRACGCALGKPVERLGMIGTQGMSGRASIKSYLQNRNDWPLNNYFSGQQVGDEIQLYCPESQRENIAYMEPDDDIHYTLIALHVLETHGADFTWRHVAEAWNSCLPYNAICTAETQAILNYSLATTRMGGKTFATPEYTSTHMNPYREWIGAQIRADGWGYACAGMPELAAEFAYRDACWTHRANGIYGEMFFAAMTAAAFVESEPAELVRIGLAEIPVRCRLAHAIHSALDWVAECRDFEDYMTRIEAQYGGLSPVHTVNNALIVIGAMFFGQMDFHRAICTAVACGLDTDCNGATCGSIVGAAGGATALQSNLIAPLNDTIKPLVFGFSEITMTELAQRTHAVHRSLVERAT